MTSPSSLGSLPTPELADQLEAVDVVLREQASSDLAMVRDAASHLLAAGGKRLRPVLTLLAGALGDAKDPRIVPCAAAIELTHLASLYHDDVIDQTEVRRGVETAHMRYGNDVAVLTGDFLFARASGLAADLGGYVSRRLADTIAVLCEGQIMETAAAGSDEGSVERYLEVVRRKTASLIATSCHLGAWLAGAPDPVVAAVTAYGEALGIAFQLADDVLDIDGRAEESGKEPGTDLREGVLTLPVLDTLAGHVPGGEGLRAALDARDIDGALEILRTNGSLERARETVAAWQTRARAALGPVPHGAPRDALEGLIGFVADRTG